jgi:D-alanyl-D-alanine carboxypeptidase
MGSVLKVTGPRLAAHSGESSLRSHCQSMNRRTFFSAILALPSVLLPLGGTASAAIHEKSRSDGPLIDLLHKWLEAFNANDSTSYRAFISKYLPEGLPYIDDDLAVRDVSGGFLLLRSEITAPNQITGWLQDRSWDRFSRIIVTCADSGHLADIQFRGAPEPLSFSIARLSEKNAVRALTSKLHSEAIAGRFSGAVLIASGDRILFRQAYGMANIAQRIPAAPETRFCVGSMGKMFTAVAILQLVQRKQVALDDAIGRYLPGYPNAAVAEQVTIEHLLTHTGGTGDIFGPDYDGHSMEFTAPERFIALYGTRDLAFKPGSRWSYSNFGYVLLGAILESVTGQNFNAYYTEKIFRPASMNATFPAPSPDGVTATAYTGALATGLKAVASYYGTPAGGGYSTVDDFFAFGQALRSHRLLDPEHTRLLTTGKVDTGNGFYSLGLSVSLRNGAPSYGHSGSAPGVNGSFMIYPDSGYLTTVLCNRGYPLALNAESYIGARLPA